MVLTKTSGTTSSRIHKVSGKMFNRTTIPHEGWGSWRLFVTYGAFPRFVLRYHSNSCLPRMRRLQLVLRVKDMPLLITGLVRDWNLILKAIDPRIHEPWWRSKTKYRCGIPATTAGARPRTSLDRFVHLMLMLLDANYYKLLKATPGVHASQSPSSLPSVQ